MPRNRSSVSCTADLQPVQFLGREHRQKRTTARLRAWLRSRSRNFQSEKVPEHLPVNLVLHFGSHASRKSAGSIQRTVRNSGCAVLHVDLRRRCQQTQPKVVLFLAAVTLFGPARREQVAVGTALVFHDVVVRLEGKLLAQLARQPSFRALVSVEAALGKLPRIRHIGSTRSPTRTRPARVHEDCGDVWSINPRRRRAIMKNKPARERTPDWRPPPFASAAAGTPSVRRRAGNERVFSAALLGRSGHVGDLLVGSSLVAFVPCGCPRWRCNRR